MKVFINPGHDLVYDSGAVNPNSGLRECDVAAKVGNAVKEDLEAAGCKCQLLQSDNLYWDSQYADRNVSVVQSANDWPADVFISIHCNAANGQARGTECEVYQGGGSSTFLAKCIQSQIVSSLGTNDRGINERPGLVVLNSTTMPATLIEMEFIDNDDAAELLMEQWDNFARAIARGVTDYEQAMGL